MQDNEKKYQELIHLKEMIETKEFQEYIINPLYEELGKLKDAYDCESLREMATLKGKKWGIKWLIRKLQENQSELKNIKFELESQDK